MKKRMFWAIICLFVSLSVISQVVFAQANVSSLLPKDPKSVGSKLEIHINASGKVTVEGAQVMQISGNTFSVRNSWDESMIRWSLRTDESTKFVKRFGGKTSAKEISVGDILSFEGDLLGGGDSLVAKATLVKDWSLNQEAGEFSGKIDSIDLAEQSFVLKSEDGLKVKILAGGASINKGVRGISLNELRVGDRVLKTSGIYTVLTRTLSANQISIYQDKSIFISRNFAGVLKSISGTTLPVVLTIAVNGKDYSVKFDQNSVVLNRARKDVSLVRFVVGDNVRFYGAIRQDNLSTIDAEVLRNMDL